MRGNKRKRIPCTDDTVKDDLRERTGGKVVAVTPYYTEVVWANGDHSRYGVIARDDLEVTDRPWYNKLFE